MKNLAIIFLICFCINCKNRGVIGPNVAPIDNCFFVIKKNDIKLSDGVLDNMKMYCFQNGSKVYISGFKRIANIKGVYDLSLGVQADWVTDVVGGYIPPNILGMSSNENIKDFYLEYPNGDIDTLYIDYQHLSENEARDNPCFCYRPLNEVRFNGVQASYDPEIKNVSVYRFDKLN